ncbi:hypothetical protein RHGRI_026842 [Rhododendron griersonianum]|uniref:GRF-type domain-containing protein n=1 Tax=Rhododendron griersonianum TaxID=479676 RepID=A0AAV6IWJ7_9ERIC|nr:hypothetical protein RHGRI_026842 [Rhododendron griersonianum]
MFCFCGKPTPLRKSGTEKNPGRRFFGCANYKVHMDCGFFCWYEPSILQERADLRPMMVQTKNKGVRTVEQCESSASMTMSEEMQRTTIAMQMKIEAMQKDFDAMQMRSLTTKALETPCVHYTHFHYVKLLLGESHHHH